MCLLYVLLISIVQKQFFCVNERGCYIIKIYRSRCYGIVQNVFGLSERKYNEKVYKIPIALPVTCPNRDGTLDSDGCIFCGSIRADYETKAVGMEITRQIDRSISHVGPKYKAKKFIAYF